MFHVPAHKNVANPPAQFVTSDEPAPADSDINPAVPLLAIWGGATVVMIVASFVIAATN